MTTREKVGQLVGTYVGTMWTHKGPDDVADEIREYGVGSAVPFGVSAADTADPLAAAELANELQEVAIEETRLGIPLVIPVDATHGHAYVLESTVLPHGLGMGATRRPALARAGASVTASECRATGASVAYSPTADIAADQRWGRAFETFGETATLAGAFARAKVEGLQGGRVDEDDSHQEGLTKGVAACVKHFPAYGQPVGGEDAAPVDVSETTLRERFLPPFEDVMAAAPAVMMPCYNAVGVEPAHSSTWMLEDLLRGELGFDGAVFSDWGAIRMLDEDHHVARDHREATYLARQAGVDSASVDGPTHAESLLDLLEAGELSEQRLDRQVERILALKFELGLFEDPYVEADRVRDQLFTDEHRATALEAARDSMTLLDNDGVLPLDASDDVLVTGPNADSLVGQCGGWTWPDEDGLAGTTVREGLDDALDGDLVYEPGADYTAERDLEAVETAARDADAAVAVVGEGWYIHEFGGDGSGDAEAWPRRDDLSLPPAQRRLLDTLFETPTPTAVVLVSGRPLAVTEAAERADAVLMAYYPGSTGGTAVAETLLGDVNPGGALPVSVPRSASRVPERIEDRPHPTPIGSEHHLDSYDPLYPFGHGESYTDFEVGAPEAPATVRPGERVTVEVPVENVGDRAGERVVDVFVRDRVSSVVTPRHEHVGFDRVAVDPGETETATVEFAASELSVQDGRERRIEPGAFEVIVGEESATIELESDY
ncbi:glycosyl hydrolase [Halococcoides cellulosivorans]|uniref:beta-glucosidase n=2 Tax=Halococcoides cellulosivorans TaxID=1679096 RepID=A0A2R4X4H4_9EURY|nr:glycosyl hydrolase [Halococcoides cellulosivorans]